MSKGEPAKFSKDEMLNWIVTSLGEHNATPFTPKETADYLRGHKVEEWVELMPYFFDGGAVGFVEGVTDALAKKKSWSGVPRQR